MKKQSKKILTIFGVIVSITMTLALALCSTQDAHAADTAGLLNKWYYTLYYTCMGSSNVESKIDPIPESGNIIDKVFKKSGDMYYPSYNLAGKEKDNCREVAKTRTLTAYASSSWSSASSAQSFMENKLKYKVEMTEGESAFNIVAKTQVHYTNYYIGCNWFGNSCESDYEGESRSVRITSTVDSNGTRTYSYEDGFSNFFNSLKVSFENHNMILKHNAMWIAGCFGGDESKTFALKASIREFYNDVTNGLENISWSDTCTTATQYSSSTTRTTYTFTTDGDSEIVDHSEATAYEKTSTSAKDSVDALVNGGLNAIKFDETDFYILYDYYLNKFIDASGATANKKTCNPSNTANLTQVKLYDNESKSFKDCYVNFNGKDPGSVTVYTQNPATPSITTTTLSAVVNWFNTVDTSKIDTSKIDGVNKTEEPEEGEGGDATKEPSCYDNAGSLGWIVCPIINQLSDFIQGAYEALVVPFMVLDAGLFTNNAARSVWEVFRNFANTAFIILFLIVIFSQLTGVGIDNYGIKKILPKLFITAVMVNLSYIICQLAVDVSNILGKAIGDLLSLDAGTFSMSEVPAAKVDLGAGAIVVQVIAGVVALGIVLTKGVAIIVPVLMGLLSIAIAIFFLFVLLAVRKAFALILVIVSPMAFVCYALPNTKKIFDKWFNTFKGLLLAFPICSAMVYGGQFAAKIILMSAAGGTGGAVAFSLILTAAVISIVPIFLIPKVLRASMGAIAMGVMRAQGGLDRRMRHGVGTSHMARNLEMTHQQAAARRAAGLKRNGNLSLRGKAQDFRQKHHLMTKTGANDLSARRDMAMGQLGMASIAGRNFGEAGKARRQNKMNSIQNAQQAMDIKEAEDAIRNDSMLFNSPVNQEGNGLEKGLQAALEAGDTTKASAYQNILYGKGDHGRSSAQRAVAAAQATMLAAGAGSDQGKKISQALQTYGSNAMGGQYAGDLKKNARSDYEFAQAMAGGDTTTAAGSYRAIDKAQKYNANAMATMDDRMIDDLQKSLTDYKTNPGDYKSEDIQAAQRSAYEALNNSNIDLKPERRAALEKIAEGYTPAAAAPAVWKDDSGTPITSPAQLTDDDIAYHNKLKQMAEADGGTISVDHSGGGGASGPSSSSAPVGSSSTSGGTMTSGGTSGVGGTSGTRSTGSGEVHVDHRSDSGSSAPAGGSVSSSSAPVGRGENGRGINDATGKERAAEGNRFDYHPKREGEDNATYSARAQWEKEMAALGEKAGERREIVETNGNKRLETHQEWQERAGIKSFDSWRSSRKDSSGDRGRRAN